MGLVWVREYSYSAADVRLGATFCCVLSGGGRKEDILRADELGAGTYLHDPMHSRSTTTGLPVCTTSSAVLMLPLKTDT